MSETCAGASIAEHENQSAGFAREALNTDTPWYLPCVTADEQISNQCLLEDDLEDIAAFPVFTKQTSRRLRRTSIQIFRKSLHSAEEDIASEEQCDTVLVSENVDNETTTADVEINSTIDDVLREEHAPVPTESNHSLTLPTTNVENMHMPAGVQTAELPSVTISDSIDNPKAGISLMCLYTIFVYYFFRAFIC